MFISKLNFVESFGFALLGAITASIEPALAGTPGVPAPIVGAGLPAVAVLAGGYWLIKKLRKPR
jgi:lipopolysaccharide export LptBFGC system permease protein LptF